MNPLHAYRLSEKAIATFTMSADKMLAHFVQEKINQQELTIADLFEEVPIKIQRSHMQQAYLFDYIQPEMPAFNTNLFKLSTPDYMCTHVHQAIEVTEALTTNQGGRMENLQKAYIKLKMNSKSGAGAKVMAQAASDDTNSNKMDYFLMA